MAYRAGQSDLFEPAVLSGLRYGEAATTIGEEAALIDAVEATALSPFRFQGWLGKRQTASFGWHYDFDGAILGPAAPIPAAFELLRLRAAAFAGLPASDLVQTLLTRYDPGAGIGWHRDRPVFEDVVGISLGAPAMLRFRRRTNTGFERRMLLLAPRSIYHLGGEARHVWEHSIAEMAVTRWSVTFRSFSAIGAQARNQSRAT